MRVLMLCALCLAVLGFRWVFTEHKKIKDRNPKINRAEFSAHRLPQGFDRPLFYDTDLFFSFFFLMSFCRDVVLFFKIIALIF